MDSEQPTRSSDPEKKDDSSSHDLPVSTESSPEKQIEIPEGGREGWMTVIAVFFFNCATWASNSAYAVYLAHYLQYDTFPNASKLDYATIGGIAFGCGLLIAPLLKLFIRRVGVRPTIVIGSMFQFAGLMLAAFSKTLWQIYLTQGVLIGIGLALITIPAMTVIPQWFRKRRSLAIAIAAAGSGVGGVVFNLSIQAMIKSLGLRWALIIQAIMCVTCCVIGFLLVRTRHQQIQTVMTVWEWAILRHKVYWLFNLYICFTLLGYVVLMYNLADFTISLGYTAHQGSIVSCMISVGIVIGRPIVGRLSDRFGAVTVSIFAHTLVGLLCLAMWIPARNLATAIAFALIQGGTMGSIWVVISTIGARIVGIRKLEVALCMSWIIIGSFGIVSPIVGIKLRGSVPAGESYDPTQYKYPAVWCGVVYLVSALMLWLIRAFLLARDVEAERQSSHEDSDELSIHVSWGLLFSKLFSSSNTRNV